ncbi:Gfo/Idh/MocA family oxidoreductase [Salicibibacter cibarius]|uniref:Gfo/Idh/MocA family oxidoreductase n=1 Tax=Salicibibacter cibarius TaxID=2743000 RepID=A0A7T6Z5F5_9BACI|nr:Gfo/Idh/MocA family oxidoreductase [Salicibibacter cibarius]QQK77340.1 Gfo/Idh/MocA family oxidoreductase [Salicibibacter cibarius]
MRYIKVGLIGYKFMGKAHTQAYKNTNFYFEPQDPFQLKVICGRNEKSVKSAAHTYGWESYETDWRSVVERNDIDLIDIGTPSNTHKDIAIAAAKAGKHVLTEKPMALSVRDAKEMLKAVTDAGVQHMVSFNYRRIPAIALAKRLITEGRLGDVYHIRAHYLQDWLANPQSPFAWRLDKTIAGSGAHGDLNAHIVDLTRYLIGEFDEVVGMSETFVKERPAENGEGKRNVTVDDTTLFLARFDNGAVGNFEATRYATGRKNHEYIEINGSMGSIVFNFERMNELQFFSKEDEHYLQGYRNILVTEPEVHEYMNAWWPPGHLIGYEHAFTHQASDLARAITQQQPVYPNFEDGLRCQQVLEAVDNSILSRTWEKVEKSND